MNFSKIVPGTVYSSMASFPSRNETLQEQGVFDMEVKSNSDIISENAKDKYSEQHVVTTVNEKESLITDRNQKLSENKSSSETLKDFESLTDIGIESLVEPGTGPSQV